MNTKSYVLKVTFWSDFQEQYIDSYITTLFWTIKDQVELKHKSNKVEIIHWPEIQEND